MFENQLVEFSSFVKNIIKEDNEMQRKFYKNLESIVDEDNIIDELMEKWNEMIDEPKIIQFKSTIKKTIEY